MKRTRRIEIIRYKRNVTTTEKSAPLADNTTDLVDRILERIKAIPVASSSHDVSQSVPDEEPSKSTETRETAEQP